MIPRLAGHLRTVAPYGWDAAFPAPAPPGRPWRTTVDGDDGPIRLSGMLALPPGSTRLVVLVHGIGGSSDSFYVRHAATRAHALGLATLRLDLRGADRQGASPYHAGLTDDVHAAVRSPEIAAFDDVGLLGFSLGGHVVLRTATESLPDHVRAVATVSPPLDLALGAQRIDRPRRLFYRRSLLSGLKEIYAAVHARRGGPVPLDDAMAIRSMIAWDDRIIAPWFGFDSAQDYYARMSVGPRLGDLTRPTLLVHSRHDPICEDPIVLPWLGDPPQLTHRLLHGRGHVEIPDVDLDLGVSGRGLDAILRWLGTHR